MDADLYFFDCSNQNKESPINNENEKNEKNNLINESKCLTSIKYKIEKYFTGIH